MNTKIISVEDMPFELIRLSLSKFPGVMTSIKPIAEKPHRYVYGSLIVAGLYMGRGLYEVSSETYLHNALEHNLLTHINSFCSSQLSTWFVSNIQPELLGFSLMGEKHSRQAIMLKEQLYFVPAASTNWRHSTSGIFDSRLEELREILLRDSK